jgi:lipopolysaccharide exporter
MTYLRLVVGPGPPPVHAETVTASELKAASISGARWISLARIVAEAVAFGSSVVLAHLISPAEFGRAAIALGIIMIALAIGASGFGAPLIQMRSIERAHVETATFLSVFTGVLLTLAMIFVLAPYAVEPAFGGRVAYLLKLAAPIFLLTGLGTVPNAVMRRRLEFRRLSQIEILAMASGPTTSIVLATTAGLNAEALILGGLAMNVVGTGLTLLLAPVATPRWRRREAAQITSFGAFAAVASITGTIYSNIDYAILGARLTARDVGLYWRAYQLGVEYQGRFSAIMMQLAFPIYSRVPNLDEMRRLRGKIVRANTIVLFPVLTTLIALAPVLVPFVFGDEWKPAVFPTQILAIAGLGAVAAVGTAPLLLAAGKPRPLAYYTVVWLVGYAAVVTWASGHGLRTVVVAVTVYQLLLVAARFLYLEGRHVGIPVRETWSAILPAAVAGGISLVSSYSAARVLEGLGTADVVVVLVAGPLGIAVYGLALRTLFRASWQEMIELGRAFVGRSKPGAGRDFGEVAAGEEAIAPGGTTTAD